MSERPRISPEPLVSTRLAPDAMTRTYPTGSGCLVDAGNKEFGSIRLDFSALSG